ncbi:Transposase IS200 like protein [Gimesia alba]|uniref:Transposase IS200 like protein n=1 Tax=Gimesia alba TaxID=2527973 RepID=A0A517RBV8_9PLAN|nr:transposase [Gimesia alba]QDT41379.1 Transposase IS200 like protein [Gimesia alba]
MSKRRIFDDQRYVHFITFSCFGNRRCLDHDDAKKRVLGTLNHELTRHNEVCVGFVIMPDHVHCLIWFQELGKLSVFMRDWKRSSSRSIKLFIQHQSQYAGTFAKEDPIWQKRYYSFEIESEYKIEEKLNYMHMNPVRKGLVNSITEWAWSSARHYELSKSVGVPISWPKI